MKILVTGASGGLGVRLLTVLRAMEKVSVRVLVHKNAVGVSGVERVEGDLSDLESLQVAATGVDRVLHLAARTRTHRENEYHEVNVEGTHNLLTACTNNSVSRFVFMSSGAAHPEGGAYSKSKLYAESRVRAWQGNWVILRPREVYGPGTTEGVHKLLRWIEKYRMVPVIGDGRYGLSPVHIDDVVRATVQALVRDGIAGETLTLAGPETMDFLTLLDRLGIVAGLKPKKVYLPASLVRGAARVFSALGMSVLMPDQVPRLLCDKPSDNGPAARLLDFNPRTLEEGLGDVSQ